MTDRLYTYDLLDTHSGALITKLLTLPQIKNVVFSETSGTDIFYTDGDAQGSIVSIHIYYKVAVTNHAFCEKTSDQFFIWPNGSVKYPPTDVIAKIVKDWLMTI